MPDAAVIVYCDRLSWTGSAGLVRVLRSIARRQDVEVRVLDPLPPGWRGVLLRRIVAWFAVAATEETFYAGHLTSADGRPAQRAAAEGAMAAVFPEARRVIDESAALTRVNRAWGRNTVWLHLCKAMAMTYGGERSLYGYALRIEVARALSRKHGRAVIVLVEAPMMFGTDCLQQMAPEIVVMTYGSAVALMRSRVELLRQIVRAGVRRVRGLRARVNRRAALARFQRDATARPGLLLPQDDDLASDRSYRSQPHWLLPGDAVPAFNTFVLAQKPGAPAPAADVPLTAAHVTGVSDDDLLALSWTRSPHPIVAAARRDARRCRFAALRSTSAPEVTLLAITSRLLTLAAELGAASRPLNVRAFMTGENYLLAGDAMALVAEPLGIHTLSYQYTNLAIRSPAMMTTADVMLTFSAAFPPHWVYDGMAPRAFIEAGYPFDHVFAMVKGRAADTKQRLRAAGATCVITYFDENFLRGTKYGLTTFEEHCAELRRLLELVVRDASIGLITKVQFERNSASRIPELQPLVRQAEATGRFVDLVRGAHRNVVFPAEAALASDMVIGHAIGGTAGLEAALAGSRCVMLNPYQMRDANHPEYARADIVMHDLEEALSAIDAFRRGERPRLGDWTPILDRFDRYRDGAAARRLRAMLDCLLGGAAPPAGAPDVARALDDIARADAFRLAATR